MIGTRSRKTSKNEEEKGQRTKNATININPQKLIGDRSMVDEICRGVKKICYFTEGKDTRRLRVRKEKIPYVSVQVVVRKREDP